MRVFEAERLRFSILLFPCCSALAGLLATSPYMPVPATGSITSEVGRISVLTCRMFSPRHRERDTPAALPLTSETSGMRSSFLFSRTAHTSSCSFSSSFLFADTPYSSPSTLSLLKVHTIIKLRSFVKSFLEMSHLRCKTFHLIL